jgi:hypothetical protein
VLFVDGVAFVAGILLLAAFVAALWAMVASQYRSSFAPLFVQKPTRRLDAAAHSTHETNTANLIHA